MAHSVLRSRRLVVEIAHCSSRSCDWRWHSMRIISAYFHYFGDNNVPITTYFPPISLMIWFQSEVTTRVHTLLYYVAAYSVRKKERKIGHTVMVYAHPRVKIPRMILTQDHMVSVQDIVSSTMLSTGSGTNRIVSFILSLVVHIHVSQGRIRAKQAYKEDRGSYLTQWVRVFRCRVMTFMRAGSGELDPIGMNAFSPDSKLFLDKWVDFYVVHSKEFRVDNNNATYKCFL